MRVAVAVVLGLLVAAAIAVVVSDTWPATLAPEWLSRDSTRARFIVSFVVLGGGVLLPILALAALVAALVRRLRRR